MPQITITAPAPPLPPGQSEQGALGGWAPYVSPQARSAPQTAQSTVQAAEAVPQGPGGWGVYTPPTPQVAPEIGTGEAAMRAFNDAITFGFYPAMAGAASGIEALTEGKDFGPAYEKTRAAEQTQQEEAAKQHPYVTAGAEIVGSLPLLTVPGLGTAALGAKAATTAARLGQSAKVGATAGGLFGAGHEVSKGGSPLDIAEGAGGGAVAGGVIGGALGGAVEGVTGIGNRVASIVRGKRDAEAEAARIVADTYAGSLPEVKKLAADTAAIKAGREAGTPLHLADIGGAPGHALMRGTYNLAPEARDIIGEPIGSRFQQQSDRIGQWIRSKFGGLEADVGTGAIKAEARKQNKPLYDLAYRRGVGGMWSEKSPIGLSLSELSSSPAVRAAATAAAERGGNRSVAEGYGAFNPHITFQNGILKISKRGGIPTFPDMQFWDYTQRELRDMVQSLRNKGEFEQADAIGNLHKQLLAELDRLNPAFAKARGTASAFFKASDALEAGANFVTDTSISDRKAAQVIAKMKPAERQLFARGFSGELARRVEATNFNNNVLRSIFLHSGKAKHRIALALGRDGADELEALLRIEGLVDKTRLALGNSTTILQGGDAGRLATTLGGIETLKGSINPAYIIAGAFYMVGRKAAQEIDQAVYNRVAEMLMSNDPAVFRRGIQIVAKNPTFRNLLLRASDITGRQIINYLGPSGVAAAGLTAVHEFGFGGANKQRNQNPSYPEQGYENPGSYAGPSPQ